MLIDRDAAINACYDGYADNRDDCAENIRSLPIIDAVEVVRCKDCEHRPHIMGTDPDVFGRSGIVVGDDVCPCLCDDPYYSYIPDDDFFCAKGEKKTAGRLKK